MARLSSATVVVVSRGCYSMAPRTVPRLVAATDRRHPMVVVDGGAPRSTARFLDDGARDGRYRVVRRNRVLTGNEARNLGADGATTEWVAFVEIESEMSDGWLDTLLGVGEALDAATVYPAYLEQGGAGPTVHGLGCDLEIDGPPGARSLREVLHGYGERWIVVRDGLEPSARVQAEPHAMVVRREVLEQLGGLDEGLLSWFDHTDLALLHRERGLSAWMVPDATCTYLNPPIAVADAYPHLLRWSRDWYERSKTYLCRKWGLDPEAPGWEPHARYRVTTRQEMLAPGPRLGGAVARATEWLEPTYTAWWDRQRRRDGAVTTGARR